MAFFTMANAFVPRLVLLVPLVLGQPPPQRTPLPPLLPVPREAWLGNYSTSWASERTIITLGPTPNSLTAYNRVQLWSPAHGVVNGSSVTMTFGKDVLRGLLKSSGYIQWENDSRWLKDGSPASKMAAAMRAKHMQPAPAQKAGSATTGASYESYATYDSDSYATYSYDSDSIDGSTDGSYTYSYETYSYEDEPAPKAGPASTLTLKSKGSKGSPPLPSRSSVPSTKAPPTTKPPQGRAPPIHQTASLSGAGRVKSTKPKPTGRR